MYRRVLGLVSRAVRGVYSHIHAMCRYDLCMYGIHSMVRGRFSHVWYRDTCCMSLLLTPLSSKDHQLQVHALVRLIKTNLYLG